MILGINSDYSPDGIKKLAFAKETLYTFYERGKHFEIFLRIISSLTVPIQWVRKGRGASSRG